MKNEKDFVDAEFEESSVVTDNKVNKTNTKDKLIIGVLIAQSAAIVLMGMALSNLSIDYNRIDKIVESKISETTVEAEVDYDRIESIVKEQVEDSIQDDSEKLDDFADFFNEKTGPAKETAKDIIRRSLIEIQTQRKFFRRNHPRDRS